ncbi:polysaccharide biosynthesis protein [Mucilaginibacter paludis DSM 18603]|uniref:Polysaccharide biosynthesis protein n=2 Tax=Mucilaginibacter TaxID=423349 RepID=H1Y8U1_9SPHI|nr:polysaccharide biosynthesis protein [Mucilaginibacter paludis DSM 18603]
MMSWFKQKKYLQSSLIRNSAWGIIANVLQLAFVFVFFAIVARRYNTGDFARFLISNTVYQLVAAFSSMGLGQWFIRQYATEDDKLAFTGKFLKTQIGLGALFYLVNTVAAFLIYPDGQIRILCIVLGTNIVFDNLINAIKSLNIAENEQRKTASILVIDGFLKLLVGCLLFIYPFTVVVLAVLMIVVRLFTLSLFIKLGSSSRINLKLLWFAEISLGDIKLLIIKNWQFIVIGSISIIYWKIGNIIISKLLTLHHVADYEIAFRIFSVLQIMPVVASATIYPRFITYFNNNDKQGLIRLYKNVFLIYSIFAVLSYAFIYTFSGFIIPLAFGKGYPGAVLCLQQMFLTFLLLPTVLLQANLIVAIGLEKLDMWFNVASLIINVAGCLIGLYFIKELMVVNYAVFISFIVFHILQDIILIRKGFMTVKHCLLFYLALLITVCCCQYFTVHINPVAFFIAFFAVIALPGSLLLFFRKKELSS